MKKKSIKLFGLIFAGLMSVGLLACGDDPITPEIPPTPEPPKKEEAMSPTEQKEYLEIAALDFMDEISASDFKKITNLSEELDELYGEDYDWENVEEWVEHAFESSRQALGTKTTETEKEEYWGTTYIYNNIYTNYKSVLMASNFTGHFTARNGMWTREDSKHLQFDFTDKQGKPYTLKLVTSGKVKKVHMLDIDDWEDYDSEQNGDEYISNEYYDRTSYTIGLPETITVSLTQGNSEIIKNTIHFDLSDITSEEFDISKNSLSLSTTFEMDNGYKVEVSKAAYSANKNASVSFVISKGKKMLVTMGVSSDVNDLPSVNLGAFNDFDIDDYETDKTNAKNAFVKLDIIGKVQLQGTLSNVRKFADYLEEAEENDENESMFKSYINQANSLADINLFYDGKSVKQADVKFETFAEEDWYGDEYWTVEPVLYFFDGSSYSSFEAFFYEKDFKETVDTFEKLIDDFAELFDEDIDW